jgi:hypothetical protein
VAKALAVDHMANLHGLVFGLLDPYLSAAWIGAITAMLSAALLLYMGTRKPPNSDALPWALMGSVLLSYYLFFHDVTVLLVPIVVAFDRFLLMEWNAKQKTTVILASVLFVFPILISYTPQFLYLTVIPLIGLFIVWKSSPSPAVASGSEAT